MHVFPIAELPRLRARAQRHTLHGNDRVLSGRTAWRGLHPWRAQRSNLDALLADACVVVSRLIQHGVEPREIASSMGRLGNAEPASIIGAVIDLAAAMSQAPQIPAEAHT